MDYFLQILKFSSQLSFFLIVLLDNMFCKLSLWIISLQILRLSFQLSFFANCPSGHFFCKLSFIWENVQLSIFGAQVEMFSFQWQCETIWEEQWRKLPLEDPITLSRSASKEVGNPNCLNYHHHVHHHFHDHRDHLDDHHQLHPLEPS